MPEVAAWEAVALSMDIEPEQVNFDESESYYDGNPFDEGIKDFHFHDLRHTWASWHVQSGTPLFVLKELGGWENIEMVKKYAHLNAGHLAEHVNVVTFWSQQQAQKQRAAG